ncbi:MAG: MYG1 family protein [Patescibacteria group bacterium]
MPINIFKNKITVAIHSGDFHADDVFACATLSLWAESEGKKLKIIRTRDQEVIGKADMVVDVGNIYNPDENKFDHHQKGGAGKRENGIPYASFGTVWKKYGAGICGSGEIADRVEKNLVIPVDAMDNGVNISKVNELNVIEHRTSDMICNFNPTWQENKLSADKQFAKAMNFAKEILLREIAWAKALILGKKETERIIEKQNNPEILILESNVDWHEAVSENKKIKFVIYPRIDKYWSIQVAKDNLKDYNSDRIKFPKDWWGQRDEALISVSGVKEAVFCADKGWFAVAKTKKGAIEMANKALQINQN